MRHFLKFFLVGTLAVVASGSTAMAADLPEPPVYDPPSAFGAWYLRGHIGMSNQQFGGLDHPAFDNPVYFEWLDEGNFDSAPIAGVGFGYRFNDWFRVDLTGEYRGKAEFSALDRYSDQLDPEFDDSEEWGTNNYSGKKSEWLFLANAYYDIGTWQRVTPYVGAGIGASYNTITDFVDINAPNSSGGFAGTGHEWNLAWALHAGMSYKATKNLFIDFGYSFVNLGNGTTSEFTSFGGQCSVDPCQSMKFKDIISHDVKLGFRWEFGGDDYYDTAMVKY